MKLIPGAVNADIYRHSEEVQVVDLSHFPWPWDSGQFDIVNAEMFLEHVPELVKTMAEIHRVLRDGGSLCATIPYWTGSNAWDDPTHIRAFTSKTFDWFCPRPERSNYMTERQERPRWEMVRSDIEVSAALPVLNIVPKLLGPMYERLFCHILPAQGLRIEMIARKASHASEATKPRMTGGVTSN